MYICLCNAITESDIRNCGAREGACTLRDLERCLGVGANCGRCKLAAKQVLRESRAVDESRSRVIVSGAPA
jgi:bacterioferritin-associated ferredoxin